MNEPKARQEKGPLQHASDESTMKHPYEPPLLVELGGFKELTRSGPVEAPDDIFFGTDQTIHDDFS